jgi:arsenite methyltransferase
VLQDEAFMASALRQLIESDAAQAHDRFLPLLHRWKAAQYPDTPQKIAASAIVNYSERNLFDFVRSCGFTEIRLELHIDMLPSIIRSWEVFMNFSPHPWAPSLKDILARQFTDEEQHFFEQTVRPIVESPEAVAITRVAFLSALKPHTGPSGGVVNYPVLLDR